MGTAYLLQTKKIIGYKKYWCKKQRRGKDCYYLELSSAPPASLINGGDAIVINQRIIEIPFRFTEPFVFDTIDFTSEVQSEFDEKVKERILTDNKLGGSDGTK